MWKTVDYEVKLLFQNKSLMIISFKAAELFGVINKLAAELSTMSVVKHNFNSETTKQRQ